MRQVSPQKVVARSVPQPSSRDLLARCPSLRLFPRVSVKRFARGYHGPDKSEHGRWEPEAPSDSGRGKPTRCGGPDFHYGGPPPLSNGVPGDIEDVIADVVRRVVRTHRREEPGPCRALLSPGAGLRRATKSGSIG